ncbi:hypothetical protein Misp01_51480 [Microtetraspora sp. NBRC 13810]|nr:hypothetical protein Misp01_51480 [Microtetraspora sp. NBRC 13810]
MLLISGTDVGRRAAQHATVIDAAAAAVVLRTDGHLNKAYELGGDVAWSFEEFAEEVSGQTGRKIAHTVVTPEEHLAILTGAGVPAAFAEILVDVDRAIGRGLLAATPGDLSRLIARPTTPIAASITTALSV